MKLGMNIAKPTHVRKMLVLLLREYDTARANKVSKACAAAIRH